MPVIHGLLAEFATAEELIAAAERVHQAGYTRVEAFAPYPLPEAAKALGYRRNGVAFLVFIGGLVGGSAAFFMLYWIEAIAYPLNVGGRPPNSWPMFIPITFELTVLIAAFASFIGVFALCRLPRFHHPLFAAPGFARSSTDGFSICIEANDPAFDPNGTLTFLEGLHPTGIEEVQA